MKSVNRELSKQRWRIKALSYALIYMVLAGLWILLSGKALELFAEFAGLAEIRGDLEIYKGWLFVLITGLALFALLRSWQNEMPEYVDQEAQDKASHQRMTPIRMPVIYLLGMVLIVTSGGFVVFEHLKQSEQIKIEQNLSAIADLKAAQINGWLRQNINFASAAGNGSYLASSFELWARTGALPESRAQWVHNRLATLRQSYPYGDIALYDLKGKPYLSNGDTRSDVLDHVPTLLPQVIESKTPAIGKMHWHDRLDGTRYASLPMVAPLTPTGTGGAVVGVLMFELNPEKYLFPLIKSWPTPSPSAETLLVQRDGDSVTYLNELRHQKDTLLSTVRLEDNPAQLAVQAASGKAGFISGVDYRGTPVIGYALKIPDTDWLMVAKISTEEIEQPIRQIAINVASTAFLLAFVGSLSLYFWWRQRRGQYETERIKAELQQQVLTKQVSFLSKNVNDIILLMDENGAIVEANDRAETAYGYSQHELIGLNVFDLRANRTQELFDHDWNGIKQKKSILFESRHQRRDGTQFPVEVSSRLIEMGNGVFVQSVIRDISERKQAEESLRASESRLSMLFNNMTIGFSLHEAIRDADGNVCDFRYLEVNPAFERMVGFRRDELIGKSLREVYSQIEDYWLNEFKAVVTTGESQQLEEFGASMGRWYSIYAYCPAPGQLAAMVQDVTERKSAERRANYLMNIYRALSETNDAIVRLEEQSALFPLACRIAVEFGGMVLAWVGIPDKSGQYLVSTASYGRVSEYVDGIRILLSPDESEGQGPSAITFREARVVVVNDFNADPVTLPWHERAHQYGIQASASFPIFRNGVPYAVFTVYSEYSNSFDEEIVKLLGEVSTNLSFALDNFDREASRGQAEIALRQSEARFRLVAEGAPFPMQIYAEDGEILLINRAWTDITGYSIEDIPTASAWVERACGEHAAFALKNIMGNFARQGRWVSDEYSLRCKDGGQRIWYFISSPLDQLDDGRKTVISMAVDVTERRQSDEALHLAATVFESSHSSILITDDQARIVAVNPAFTQITGYSNAEVIGKNPSLLQSGRQGKDFYQTFWSALAQNGRWQGEIWNSRKSGEEYAAWLSVSALRDENGVAKQYIGIADDITESKESQSRIEFMAYHDALTGLPNRMLANDRLEQAIAHAHRTRTRVAVMFLDLDDFKAINDTLGHSTGDVMLKAVADRLRHCVRDADTVSRQGGDEFLVMLSDVTEVDAINSVAIEILNTIGKPYRVAEHDLAMSTSIGIAIYPEDGQDCDTLLKNADMAMYNAKQSGRNTHRFFAEKMNDYVLEHLLIRNGLMRALENQEFCLQYQPQLDLSEGRLIGAEALIRWQHPELGMVPPNRFIQVAEESGMIIPIGNWVLQEACRQAVVWQKAGWPGLVVGVNISAVQFRRGDMEQIVSAALAEAGLAPQFLELELTESILIQDVEKSLEVIQRLKDLGVRLSIDDFGTGYSSLAYLRQLPVDKLKIDQSFVKEITIRKDDAAIALSIITLAHTLQKRVIAEGVETVEQLRFLQQNNCDEIQGYLLSRPLTVEDFAKFLEKGVPRDILVQN